MKTAAIFLFFSLLLSAIGYGQRQWIIEPQVGVNLVPIKENNLSGTTFKMGPNLGLLVGTSFGKWTVKTGLLMNRRYAHYSYSEKTDELAFLKDLIDVGGVVGDLLGPLGEDIFKSSKTVNGYTEYWTLDLPITLSYQFESGLYFLAGPYINYLTSVKNKELVTHDIPLLELVDLTDLGVDQTLVNLLPGNESEEIQNDSKEQLNEIDYGLLAGIGFSGEKWTLQCAYQYGFNAMRKDDYLVGSSHAQAIQLSIGYHFIPHFEKSKLQPKYDLELIK